MPCGVVLREALKHEAVAEIILYDQSHENEKATKSDDIDLEARQTGEGVFWQFFPWIDGGAFEVSTDAFTTFRVGLPLLTHRRLPTEQSRKFSLDTSSSLPAISTTTLTSFSKDTTTS